jgi:hypothetical protein
VAGTPLRRLALGALALTIASCGARTPETQEHSFATPVALAALLETPGVRDPSSECELQILDGSGQPVPHALLRMQWPEAGRLAFQTDERGLLTVRLCDPLESAGVMLSAEDKPSGQDLLEQPYEAATRTIQGARLLVRVHSGVR